MARGVGISAVSRRAEPRAKPDPGGALGADAPDGYRAYYDREAEATSLARAPCRGREVTERHVEAGAPDTDNARSSRRPENATVIYLERRRYFCPFGGGGGVSAPSGNDTLCRVCYNWSLF